MSADPERGLVYIPTNGATIDYYGGFRPGDNLFSTSIIALDVEDRQARLALPARPARHLELRHADRAGPARRQRRRPAHPGPLPDHQAVVRLRLQPRDRRADLADREAAGAAVEGAGREALEDAAVPDQAGAVRLPGPQGIGSHRLHARDQEARARACAKKHDLLAELFEPPRHRGNAEGRGPANICPGGGGGANITGPPAADPVTGMIFIAVVQRLLADAAAAGQRSATTTR